AASRKRNSAIPAAVSTWPTRTPTRTIAATKANSERETCEGPITRSAYASGGYAQGFETERVYWFMAAKLTGKFLLREVNARIREISDRFGTIAGHDHRLCECGREDCDGRVEVPVVLYDEARRNSRFFFAPGHAVRGADAEPGLVAAEPVRFQ